MFNTQRAEIDKELESAKKAADSGDTSSADSYIRRIKESAVKFNLKLTEKDQLLIKDIYKNSRLNNITTCISNAQSRAVDGDVHGTDLWINTAQRNAKEAESSLSYKEQEIIKLIYRIARERGIDKSLSDGHRYATENERMLAEICLDKIARYTKEIGVSLTPQQQKARNEIISLLSSNNASSSSTNQTRSKAPMLSNSILNKSYEKFNSDIGSKKFAELLDLLLEKNNLGSISIPTSPAPPANPDQITPPKVQTPINSITTIGNVAELGNVGTLADLELLKKALGCINVQILKNLSDAGFTISVARANIADAADAIRGRKVDGTTVVNDLEGLTLIKENEKKILIKTFFEDGDLRIDFASLINEVGNALWFSNYLSGSTNSNDFKSIYEKEKSGFDDSRFHSEEQYKARTFVLFALDPEKLKAQFPKTYNYYSKLNIPKDAINNEKLIELYKQTHPRPDLTLESDLYTIFNHAVEIERVRRSDHGGGESLIIFLAGEKQSTKLVAKQLGNDLIYRREKSAPYCKDEGFIHVTKESTNDLGAFFNKLKSSRGAILYIDDVATFTADSPFMQAFNEFCKNHNGWCHLVIACSESESTQYNKFLDDNPRISSKVEQLSPEQVVNFINKFAATDGKILTEEAAQELVPQIKRPFTISESYNLWVSIETAHRGRLLDPTKFQSLIPEEFSKAISEITPEDIQNADIASFQSPLEKLDKMIGLKNIKNKIEELISGIKLNKYLAANGQPTQEQRRLNFMWPGNPGTGKTSVARLVAQILYAEEVLENSSILEISASELIEKGASYAMKKFKENQGGVIFIDEFHQLDPSNNPKGKEIIDLLIPLLTSKEWEKTAFITAGYKRKLEKMMKSDEGLFSRLEVVEFEDYTIEELKEIVKKELKNKRLTADEIVVNAIMDRVQHMQQSTMYPANARNAVKIVELVSSTQRNRLEKIISTGNTPTIEELNTILIDDVIIEGEISPEDVLKEINDTISGNQKFKNLMSLTYGLVKRNKQLGYDIREDIPMSIAIDGPPGTGKTTMARLAGKLYHALGIVPNDTLVETQGGKMVGGFVGNSSALAVDEKFEEAFGGVLLIDEISAMTSALEFSQQAIKQLLTNMVDPENPVLVIIADYKHNIDAFMSFDSGVSARFKVRFSTEVMTVEAAKQSLNQLISQKYQLEDGCLEIIERKLSELVSIPQFASGRDVNSLAEFIAKAQVNEFQSLVNSQSNEISSFDWKLITKDMVENAFNEFLDQVRQRPLGSNVAYSRRNRMMPFDVQSQNQAEQDDRKKELFTAEENQTRLALIKVNESYAEMANTKPDEFKKLLEDPQSEYYTKVGKELNTSSDDAYSKISELQTKFSSILDERDPKKELVFDYDCPFCGGVNSPKCHYFSNSEPIRPEGFLYSTEWLVMHSRKPPYFAKSE